MWPDRVSNPGPLTLEAGALPTVLRGPAVSLENLFQNVKRQPTCDLWQRAPNDIYL